MKIGLIDVDSHNSPNLVLMKLSAYHKAQGNSVEWYSPMFSSEMDIVYMSKVFTFTNDYVYSINAKKIIRGGTGYFYPDGGERLPQEIEHTYPDYSLYGDDGIARGFLTRGCPRGCEFCIVKNKEGRKSIQVANLEEFWSGQKNIMLYDPNILACNEWQNLFEQLVESKSIIDFNQGLDVRMMTEEKIAYLNAMRIKRVHLAWDNPNEDLTAQFEFFTKHYKRKSVSGKVVYVLVNFNSTIEQDLYRIYTLRRLGYDPYVMIYEKATASEEVKRMARWVNNRFIWRKVERFENYGK